MPCGTSHNARLGLCFCILSPSAFLAYFCWLWESPCIAQAGLRFSILLLQPPERLVYRHMSRSLCFVNVVSIWHLLDEPGSIKLKMNFKWCPFSPLGEAAVSPLVHSPSSNAYNASTRQPKPLLGSVQ